MTEFRRAKRPCPNCPWRVDAEPGEFTEERHRALARANGRPGDEAPIGSPMFGCHKIETEPGAACAGWLAVAGHHHLTVRLAVITDRLPAEALRPGDDWPELFPDYAAMLAHNGITDLETS